MLSKNDIDSFRFLYTMATQSLLENIVSPKIVGDGSGGYIAKTDIVNIDNLVVNTINGLPPGSGGGAVGFDGKFVPVTPTTAPLDLNGHSLTDSIQNITLGKPLNMNGQLLTDPTAVKLGSSLDMNGNVITNSYTDSSGSTSILINRNLQVENLTVNQGIISSNYNSGLIDIHDDDNCGCGVKSLRMDDGINNKTYLDMNGQVLFDNTGTLNVGYNTTDTTRIRGLISGDAGPLALASSLDMHGNTLTDSTQNIKLGNPLDLNGNALTDSSGNIKVSANIDLQNNSLTSTSNLLLGTNAPNVTIGYSGTTTTISGTLNATNSRLTTPIITGTITTSNQALTLGANLDLKGNTLLDTLGNLKIGNSSGDITVDCSGTLNIGNNNPNNINIGSNNTISIGSGINHKIILDSNGDINIGNGNNNTATISAQTEVYLNANGKNLYVGNKNAIDTVYLNSPTTFNANTGQASFSGSNPVQIQNSKISPTSMVFITPVAINYNQNTNDNGNVSGITYSNGTYQLTLSGTGTGYQDIALYSKIMFDRDFLGIKGNVYYAVSAYTRFGNYGNYTWYISISDYTGNIVTIPNTNFNYTIQNVGWRLEDNTDLSINTPASYSVLLNPGFGFQIWSSNHSDKSTVNYFISY